ncbi:lysyl-tRNA synthetase [Candidatus Endolissoclinum faulkneri L5]|uniref:Lysine--tRNA ligase n=1 Tax=Candidatus Endolissoclinum faulkneri L5 TaxID=1401328 RepID=V9TX39_9PROT|nr:lysine--tRNA ligase [Candidatus Endolissoclinum faulkneri]AHC73900.1 lysyl-tRNA synthetase [Candidatus Endolissoclinum faulkneri L5]
MSINIKCNFAINAKTWPCVEARKIIKRYNTEPPKKGYVLLSTGYGPSGLPHIGTYGEFARTNMVRQAFEMMSDIPTKLIAFADDMDGMRKVPTNIPNQQMVAQHLNKPLTKVPDPFGTHESFGDHNNSRLREFLDRFEFNYDFYSATECYTSGMFNDALLQILRKYDEIMNIVLPTLGHERRATYSPFLPICSRTGHVLQVPIVDRDVSSGTISYHDPFTHKRITIPITNGNCKLQWKCDWAMRWFALGVDYEMFGKDLIESVKLSSQIVKILGYPAPAGFNYELFLDANGQKISKSKGNGLSVEQWIKYGPPESLALFMYKQPQRAKRIHFHVIPKTIDEYLIFLSKFSEESTEKRIENPVWHIHNGTPPNPESSGLSFSLLINLANACRADNKKIIWSYVNRYSPRATPEANPLLDRMLTYVIRYYQDFVRPYNKYRTPNKLERAALEDLKIVLKTLNSDASADYLQVKIYEIGKRHKFDNLREWFKALYEILLGQSDGPRLGSFILLYGIKDTINLLDKVLTSDSITA